MAYDNIPLRTEHVQSQIIGVEAGHTHHELLTVANLTLRACCTIPFVLPAKARAAYLQHNERLVRRMLRAHANAL
jgi:hypothetical protein